MLQQLVLLTALAAQIQTSPVDSGPVKVLALQSIVGAGGYLLGCALHEGSHAIVGQAVGITVTNLELTPHIGKEGFTYCRVIFNPNTGNSNSKMLMFAAPTIVDLVAMTAYGSAIASGGTTTWPLPLRSLAVVFGSVILVDFTNATLSPRPQSDLRKIYKALELPNETANAITTIRISLSVLYSMALIAEETSILLDAVEVE